MQDESIKKKAVKNILWRFAERFGAQFVNLIITIVLARILVPDDFGTVAIINVFLVIFNVFVDSGMANALIQKKNVDNIDFSSVFYFNIFQGTVIYLIFYLSAPFIAGFFDNPELTTMLRVAGVVLFISGIKNVQQAYVSKKLMFQKFFWATLGGTVISSIIGIWLACNGYGVWALIVQNILNQLIDTVILWMIVKWRPERCFSFSRIKSLLSYGSKLLLSALIDTVYNNFQSIFIGKFYTEAELAYYTKGKQIPDFLVANINTTLDSVLFPIMSDVQDDTTRLKGMTRTSIGTSTTLLWPILAAVIASAPEMISVLLTDKWIDSVFFLRVFCLTYALWPIHTANLNAIKAFGKSGTFLKQEIIKKVIGVTVLLLVFDKGVYAIACSVLITAPISALINWFPNRKNISYKFWEQIKDILPALGMAVIEFAVIFSLSFLHINIYVKFGLQVLLGIAVYVLMICCFKRSIIQLMISLVRKER